jgi:hypothetical protein
LFCFCFFLFFFLIFTSDAVAITVINLFDGSIPEGKLSHPIDSAANTRGQTEASVGGGCVETIRPEIVITIFQMLGVKL